MSCNVFPLVDGCLDISGEPFEVHFTSDDTDFVQDSKAELYRGQTMIKSYDTSEGITISDFNGNPRRFQLPITDISTRFTGQFLTLFIRPTDDSNVVLRKKISITNNYAKQ